MSIAAWVIAYILIGLLFLVTLVYVGVLVYKAHEIRKANRTRVERFGFIFDKAPGTDDTASGTNSPSPKRLEASVKPPSQSPYSGKTERFRVANKHPSYSILLRVVPLNMHR